MREDIIDPIVKQAIIDRVEGWELVDYLQIPIEEIVETFTEQILDNIDDVKDFIDLRSDDEDDTEDR